jgi:hypothetical protein
MTTSILYDRVLSPFYDRLAFRLFPDALHPNVITLLGGAFAAMALIALRNGAFGWSSVLFTLYHGFDNMDGKHARRTNQCSKFGAFLDHAVDGTIGWLMGYETCYYVVFGLGDDAWYWPGYHSSSCLFLAPHVVALFSGVLSLGSRFISIDEISIATTLVLATASRYGTPLIGGAQQPMSYGISLTPVEAAVSGSYALAAAYVGSSAIIHLATSPMKPARRRIALALTAAYALFWVADARILAMEGMMRYMWTPLLALMLAAGMH